MESLRKKDFTPSDLTISDLQSLTPNDPDFKDAEFLALSGPWSPTDGSNKIVILCTKSFIDHGRVKIAAGHIDGHVSYLDDEEFSKLRLGDFTGLPKIR